MLEDYKGVEEDAQGMTSCGMKCSLSRTAALAASPPGGQGVERDGFAAAYHRLAGQQAKRSLRTVGFDGGR